LEARKELDMGCNDILKIVMPRGDVRPLQFDVLEADGETMTDIEFDDIYFTVKKNFTDRDFKFQKKLSDGTITKDDDGHYHTFIDSTDTDILPFGEYVFDIELKKSNASVPDIKQTTVGRLIITEESTYARNEG
jgi:hypothetical protein